MVIRCKALMGVPGGVFVFSSWLAFVFMLIGLHNPFFMYLSGLCLAISFLLGWLIDQRRWYMPIVAASWAELSEQGGLTNREIRRARIHCGLAFACRCAALGGFAGWVYHWLQTSAAGGWLS